MASSTVARPTSIPTLNRREGLLLYSLLYLAEKQNIKGFTQRQITGVAEQFAECLQENSTFSADLTQPVNISLRSMVEECQRCGTIKKGEGLYQIQNGFIRNGYLRLQSLFTTEELRELENHTNGLCRTYLTA